MTIDKELLEYFKQIADGTLSLSEAEASSADAAVKPIFGEERGEDANIASAVSRSLIHASSERRLMLIESLVIGIIAKAIDLGYQDELMPSARLDGLGLDSLLVGQILDNLGRFFKTSVGFDDFYTAVTLSDLSQIVAATLENETQEQNSSTTQQDLLQPQVYSSSSTATKQLLVFAPIGIGTKAFKALANSFTDIEVVVIACEIGASWSEYLGNLVQTTKKFVDRPCAVYGHSFGAIVAYEVLLRLESDKAFTCELFVASSCSPPSTFSRYKHMFPFNRVSGDMSSTELIDLLVSAHMYVENAATTIALSAIDIQRQVELILTYNNEEALKLSAPILTIHADSDILVQDSEALLGWKNYTTREFQFKQIQGSHFYFVNPPKEFSELVTSRWKQTRSDISLLGGEYRLTSFVIGSEGSSYAPYGNDPQGVLIYLPNGYMAAHVWDKYFLNHERMDNSFQELMMITQFSYIAMYEVTAGIVSHKVLLSSLPSQQDDILHRSIEFENNKLVLTTLPVTANHARELPGQLDWEKARLNEPSTQPDIAVCGAWILMKYGQNSLIDVSGDAQGYLMLSESGLFSLQIGLTDRPRFSSRNPSLCESHDLIQAYKTYLSLCGTFVATSDKIVLKCDNQPASSQMIIELKLDKVGETLQVSAEEGAIVFQLA